MIFMIPDLNQPPQKPKTGFEGPVSHETRIQKFMENFPTIVYDVTQSLRVDLKKANLDTVKQRQDVIVEINRGLNKFQQELKVVRSELNKRSVILRSERSSKGPSKRDTAAVRPNESSLPPVPPIIIVGADGSWTGIFGNGAVLSIDKNDPVNQAIYAAQLASSPTRLESVGDDTKSA